MAALPAACVVRRFLPAGYIAIAVPIDGLFGSGITSGQELRLNLIFEQWV